MHRIKKSSAIVCGGVPVDLSRLPWPSSALKYIIGIAASILVLVGIGFGVWKFLPSGGKTWDTEAINNRYNSSVVMMVGTYHYEVTIGDMKPEFQKLLRDKFGLPRQIIFIKGEPVDKENITDDMFFQIAHIQVLASLFLTMVRLSQIYMWPNHGYMMRM